MPYDQAAERTKSRIPNKTQWALMDIIAICEEGRDYWESGMERAERTMDPIALLHLARLGDSLNQIEKKASSALNGEYRE